MNMERAARIATPAAIALLGAGLISVTPVTTGASGITEVSLTAASDVTQLYDNFAMAPFVSLQQVVSNLTSPGGFSDIGTNLRALFAGLTLEGGSTTHTAGGETVSDAVLPHTLDPVHQAFYDVLNNAADNNVFTDSFLNNEVPEAMWYSASPLWSMIYGEAGLLISPFVPFLNPFADVLSELVNGQPVELVQAFTDLLGAPLQVVNAFLYGDTFNFSWLDPLINSVLNPADQITHFDFTFGGLLTPGITTGATDADGTPVSDSTGVLPAGGSVLNSVGVTFAHPDELPSVLQDALGSASAISGVGIGPFGALEGWTQAIASILGWDGVGPPIPGFDLPLSGADAADAVGGADPSPFADLLGA
jgi:hypothetical protein